jgi:bifunctional DNA-binding transcriptional regulator/antitoxin component of YhaV-PrlF toxin-antitoxin module
MSEMLQVSIDKQGRIVLPQTFQERMGLVQGMTLVVEDGEKGDLCLRVQEKEKASTMVPSLVEKQGVLVVTSAAQGNLTDITTCEREQRITELVQRTEL